LALRLLDLLVDPGGDRVGGARGGRSAPDALLGQLVLGAGRAGPLTRAAPGGTVVGLLVLRHTVLLPGPRVVARTRAAHPPTGPHAGHGDVSRALVPRRGRVNHRRQEER